jgi:acyl carrier protein
MTKEEIKRIIIDQLLEIAPELEEKQIKANDNLQNSLEIDSFDFLKVLVLMYEKVGVEVPESDYEKVDTLNHMVEYFSERL